MKYLTLLAIVLSSFSLQAQTITENLVTLQQNHRPLFGKEWANLTFNFMRTYEMEKTDTAYNFMMSTYNVKSETESITVGSAVVGSISGIGVSMTSTYDKTEGTVLLDKEKFMRMYDCVNKVYTFAASQNKAEHSMVCSCSVEGITFAAENPQGNYSGNKAKYFFKFSDETVYPMDMTDFRGMVNALWQVKQIWNGVQ